MTRGCHDGGAAMTGGVPPDSFIVPTRYSWARITSQTKAGFDKDRNIPHIVP
jgi:hypothetical protein